MIVRVKQLKDMPKPSHNVNKKIGSGTYNNTFCGKLIEVEPVESDGKSWTCTGKIFRVTDVRLTFQLKSWEHGCVCEHQIDLDPQITLEEIESKDEVPVNDC